MIADADWMSLHRVTDLLWSHQVWAFNGTQIACSCDHQFRSQVQHREHTAAALLPALAAERAAVTRPLLALAEELEGWRANAERYADAHAGSIACDRALGRVRAYERAITRIRAVAAALGETGGGK